MSDNTTEPQPTEPQQPIEEAKPAKSQSTEASFYRRYRAVFIATILFFILNIGVLSLNFYTALQLSNDAISINLSGRQRMLSQRITKTLLQVETATLNNQPLQEALKELNLSYDLFSDTLQAFDTGGFTAGAAGEKITLNAVSDAEARSAVVAGKKIWDPFAELLRPILLSTSNIEENALKEVIAYAYANNLPLLAEMNHLTVALEDETNKRTSFLRWVQAFALIFLVLDYVFIIYDFLTKIKRGDREINEKAADLEGAVSNLQLTTEQLESSQRETDTILKTVRQGLLLIDPDYKISSKYSEELKTMFRLDDLQGMNFLGIMQRILTEKNYQTTRDYMEMLFDEKKREKTLLKINPLEEAEIHFQERTGQFSTSFYEFQFKRILDQKNVASVFISVRDITAQVELTQQLREAEENKDAQFSMLLAILNVPSEDLFDFCSKSLTSLLEANKVLRVEDLVGKNDELASAEDLREKLNIIFRHTHSIKGHAALLKIDYFVEMTHNIEDQISQIRSKPKLSGEDFLGIVGQIAECKDAVTECQSLSEKIQGIPAQMRPDASAASSEEPSKPSTPFGDKDIFQFNQLISELSKQTGKKAQLSTELPENLALEPKQYDLLKEATVQMLRNSFAHGIETENERTAAGKDTTAQLSIKMHNRDNSLHFEYTDDGKGFDSASIKSKAIRAGLVSEDEASSKDDYEWWFYIFESGFSTTDDADTISGRGVGLDIIRHSVMSDLGGKIYLDSEPGSFSSFQFEIPSS